MKTNERGAAGAGKVAIGLGVVLAVVAGLVVTKVWIFGTIHDKLFGPKDKEQQVLVVENKIEKVGKLTTATQTITATVDTGKDEDKGALPKFVPGVCDANSVKLQAKGTIDASIDLSEIGKGDIQVGPDKTVTITVPRPKLGDVKVDVGDIRVIDDDRGLCTKLTEDATDSAQRLDEAKSNLRKRAKAKRATLQKAADESAEEKLTALLEGLGFTSVNVVFDGSPADQS